MTPKPYTPTPYTEMAPVPESMELIDWSERLTEQIMVLHKEPRAKVVPVKHPETDPPKGSTKKTSQPLVGTSDTQVRQALQDAMNIIMRWHRLQETSVKYRNAEQWVNLTKFFKKSFYEVWVNGMGQPLMLPEDAVAIMVATANLLFAEVEPEKMRAMEVAIRKGREK